MLGNMNRWVTSRLAALAATNDPHASPIVDRKPRRVSSLRVGSQTVCTLGFGLGAAAGFGAGGFGGGAVAVAVAVAAATAGLGATGVGPAAGVAATGFGATGLGGAAPVSPAGAMGLGAIGFGPALAGAGLLSDGTAAGLGGAAGDDVVIICTGSPSARGNCGLITPPLGGAILRGSGFWSAITSFSSSTRGRNRASRCRPQRGPTCPRAGVQWADLSLVQCSRWRDFSQSF